MTNKTKSWILYSGSLVFLMEVIMNVKKKCFVLTQGVCTIALSCFIGYRWGCVTSLFLFLLMILGVWIIPYIISNFIEEDDETQYDGEMKLVEFKNGDKNYILTINDHLTIVEKDELLIKVIREDENDFQNTDYNGQLVQ